MTTLSMTTGIVAAVTLVAPVGTPAAERALRYGVHGLTSPPPPGVSQRLALCVLLASAFAAIVLVVGSPGGLGP